MKILVADDNKLSRTLLGKIYSGYGEVKTARSGEEAIDMFKAEFETNDPFGLVSLDYHFGEGITGGDTLHELRKILRKSKAECKILIISSFAMRDVVMHVKDSCDGYILKPISAAMLKDKLSELGIERKTDEPEAEELPVPPRRRLIPFHNSGELEKMVDYSNYEMCPRLLKKMSSYQLMMPIMDNVTGRPFFEPVRPETLPYFQSIPQYGIIARVDSKDIPLTCGNAAAYIPETQVIVALRGGRVVFRNDEIDVDDTLEIDKMYAAGEVRFHGKIVITGDIPNRARLSGGSDITIKGFVGECRIRCGGDVSLGCMNGNRTGKIECRNNVSADSLYSCNVSAGGNVIVSKESVNCRISSIGEIKSNIFLGGTAESGGNITVARAGSSNEKYTELRAGVDIVKEKELNHAKKKLDRLTAQIEKTELMLGTFAKKNLSEIMELSYSKQHKILPLIGKQIKLRAMDIPQAKLKYEQLASEKIYSSDAEIFVAKKICRNVSVEINNCKEIVTEDMAGPLRIRFNTNMECIVFEKNMERR